MHLTSAFAVTMLVSTLSWSTGNGPLQSPAPDACALFTLEEAGKATGRTFRRARPDKGPEGTMCALIGGTGGNINISLSPSSSKKSLDDFRKLLTEQGEKIEPVKRSTGATVFMSEAAVACSSSSMAIRVSLRPGSARKSWRLPGWA
jgi:hypothetical protein